MNFRFWNGNENLCFSNHFGCHIFGPFNWSFQRTTLQMLNALQTWLRTIWLSGGSIRLWWSSIHPMHMRMCDDRVVQKRTQEGNEAQNSYYEEWCLQRPRVLHSHELKTVQKVYENSQIKIKAWETFSRFRSLFLSDKTEFINFTIITKGQILKVM